MGNLISSPGWRFGAVLIRPPTINSGQQGSRHLGFLEKSSHVVSNMKAWPGRALCGCTEFTKGFHTPGEEEEGCLYYGVFDVSTLVEVADGTEGPPVLWAIDAPFLAIT